jgi:hypothetical protein
MAAMRRSIVTYTELARAIGMPSDAVLSHRLPPALRAVNSQCAANSEPALAALVVNATSGRPGAGWNNARVPWHGEVQRVFRHWSHP